MPAAAAQVARVVGQLAARPGHEMVRTLVHDLCVNALDKPHDDITFEVPIPEVRGRADAVFGDTIFEFKRDLRRERGQAEEQLHRYLGERERSTGRRYLGIATDGATFTAYELRDGTLSRMDELAVSAADPGGLLRWLDTAVAVREDRAPEPDVIRVEFGRDSLVLRRALPRLAALWRAAEAVPEAVLKRDLWQRHLEFVYGTLLDPAELFLHHTYLTIVAKCMAARVLTADRLTAGDILDGTPFVRSGIDGAVEMDFFDWVRLVEGGTELVERIHRQVARFRMEDIDTDVLKALYESLIDANQRRYLGEYYTPDWLALWICEEAIPEPLATRALDPSCGSGTFLFHAVRRFLAAAEEAGMPLEDALVGVARHVVGLDVHPVAVLFARVTYLLALGRDRLLQRQCRLSVPVYLGDALQWDVQPMMSDELIHVAVPGERPIVLPGSLARDPVLLERVLMRMDALCGLLAPAETFGRELRDHAVSLSEPDREMLTEAYARLRALHEAGRDHIWKYIIRNLTRPLWLSQPDGRPDVLIGNPPWLKFNGMSTDLQRRMRHECRARGLWVGGKVATHQDLSAYFFVRASERYLAQGGRVAFVMPKACLDRRQYAGFRKRRFADDAQVYLTLDFTAAWVFDSDVAPLFPVPSAVIFATRSTDLRPLPRTVARYRGSLGRRDLAAPEARRRLQPVEEPWPEEPRDAGGSPYRDLFRQGAQLLPRRFFLVREVASGGGWGAARDWPTVTSRVSTQDKAPWKDVPPRTATVERRFLRPALLGESVAPFRLLDPDLAIVPWSDRREQLMTADAARREGHEHLAGWLGWAEEAWTAHRDRGPELVGALDHYGKLSRQMPGAPLRVVYTKSGKRVAAAVVRDANVVVDHKLYWTAVETTAEARYLCAILNSETLRARVEHLQSRGAGGARDFDKVLFSVPFRLWSNLPRQRNLARLAATAEDIAASVPLEATSFTARRRSIRAALEQDGVAQEMEMAVERMLAE